jgi:RNA polymerase sigma factor (sigma-70 family)
MEDNGQHQLSPQLIEKARAGDQDAFRMIESLTRPRLAALAYMRMGSWLRRQVEVDDVLQETYLRLARSLQNFKFQTAEATFSWLETLCVHVITDLARHLRRLRRRGNIATPHPMSPGSSGGQPGSLLDLVSAPMTSPSRSLQSEERLARLEKALNSLTPEHREVLICARILVLPIRAIAARMKRTEGAVSMLLCRATQKLRLAFGTTDSWYLPPGSLDILARQEEPPRSGPSGNGTSKADDGSEDHCQREGS